MASQRSTYMMDRADGASEVDHEPTLGKVVGIMRKYAMAACEDPDFREYVSDCCAGLLQGDYNGEILALYYDVCQNIRYMKDPLGVEMVQTPQRTLKVRSGDCDDMATLLAAMLLAAGHRPRFCLVGFRPGGPPTHVYVEVAVPGGWKTLDPVANRNTKSMLGDVASKYNIGLNAMRASDGAFGEDGIVSSTMRNVGRGSQVFSIYDYRRGVYDYYKAPLADVPASGFYRKASGRIAENMAASLPSGAVHLGEGDTPKGIIASSESKEGSLGRTIFRVAFVAALVGGSIYGVHKYREWRDAA